ncbi:MAG: iron uptake transporter permease EfeU [bacterium]
MVGSFLITLREGLEAALIVGILLTYLAKIGRRDCFCFVVAGVLGAVVASGIAALLFSFVAGGFSGRNEEIFEGLVMLLAVAVLTYMVLWMNSQSHRIRGELEEKVDIALARRNLWGLTALAFVAVFREGVETVLFLAALIRESPVGMATLGGVLGVAAAVALAWAFFKGGYRISLKRFFRITGAILIVIAAGLLARGVHELQEAGVIPAFVEHLYDINFILDENGTVGSFLKALVGYNGNPSLIEVIAYISYYVVIFLSLLRQGRVLARSAPQEG